MLTKPMRLSTKTRGIYFTSDSHFWHDRAFIWGHRNYRSVEDMNEKIITTWNSIVRPKDLVIHAGDFILSDPDGSRLYDILLQLNGDIIYIDGNHNSGVKVLYKQVLASNNIPDGVDAYPITGVIGDQPHTQKHFTFAGKMFDCIIDGQIITVTHYPMYTWDKAHEGAWNLCGHEHGQFKPSTMAEIDSGKRLDIGWDLFRAPVPFDHIADLMAQKSILTAGHHGE